MIFSIYLFFLMTSYDGQDTFIIQLIAVSLSVLISTGNSIFRELMV